MYAYDLFINANKKQLLQNTYHIIVQSLFISKYFLHALNATYNVTCNRKQCYIVEINNEQ